MEIVLYVFKATFSMQSDAIDNKGFENNMLL